jgi:hypothetical protein
VKPTTFPDFVKEAAKLPQPSRQRAWLTAAEKHLAPKQDSVAGIAEFLREWRKWQAAATKKDDLPSETRLKAQKFTDLFERALIVKDWRFFRKLSEACKLADDEIAWPPDVYGMTVIAIAELWDDLKRKPNKKEICKIVNLWWTRIHRSAISSRHWRRIFNDPFIADVLRAD